VILGSALAVRSHAIPALFAGLFDDAAVFPPGNLPLQHAVSAHLWRRQSAHAAVLGPLVVAAADLPRLAAIVTESADTVPDRCPANLEDQLGLAVTVPTPHAAAEAQTAAAAVPSARLAALDVGIPDDMPADRVVPALRSTVGDTPDTAVYVEIPRDHRRRLLLSALSGTGYMAKFRTGGIRAELYPDETELADAIALAVSNGVPFKATAGLHHAVRNRDHETGFEQHGFLNVLAATGAALAGASAAEISRILADRDADQVSARVHRLDAAARTAFRSFGTCSIDEPLGELARLGLIGARGTVEHVS
jgi:hypothetical protein